MTKGLRRRPHGAAAAVALACVLCALLLATDASFAQLPKLPMLTEKSAEKPADGQGEAAPESPADAVARIRGLLERLGAPPPPVPEGIPAPEVGAAKETRSVLAYLYGRLIGAYEALGPKREARRAAEARASAWTAFPEKPPYSIQMVDRLHEDASIARHRIAPLEAGSRHLAGEQGRRQASAKREEAQMRAANDAYAQAKTDAEKNLAAWRRDAAALEARRAAAWVELTRAIQDLQTEELATRRAELRLLERQIAAAAPHVRFTEDDVAAARQRSVNAVAAITKKLDAVRAAQASRQGELDAATRELARLRDDPAAGADRIAAVQVRVDTAGKWVTTLRSEAEMLRGEITISEELPKMWAMRLAAATSPDSDDRREALERLEDSAIALQRWFDYLQGPLGEARESLREVEAKAASATESRAAGVEFHREAIAAASRSVTNIERTRDELTRISSMLNRWVEELEAQGARRGLVARLAETWSATKAFGRAIWNFELFAVEDTLMLDGRAVTTSHGVSVGKSVGALALFLGGYAVAALLMRRVARWMVARGSDEQLAATVRRWSLALIAFMLLLFTLNIARIPITVFAFLGGTLAIAVGFGTQTIFRNLISGVILLLERSVQIGDIVEVDGVSGTVTAVDLRSSTVRGFDGTETIVPNSALLENKFTNWTHNDRRVRRVVRVGVAYGSPVRQVADILEDCAKRHGLILDDPAPFVVFEDFGDNAQVFALYFWFEFKPESSVLIVMSDLRFMIERQLRDAGIVVAFPQRDVHLDSAGPLRVELVRSDGPAPG